MTTDTIDRAVSAPTLALDLITPSPTNPRRRQQNQASNLKAWKLEELAESIRQYGVKSPVIVRANPNYSEGNGRPPYELVAGERRWRASQLAGVKTIPYTLEELSDFDVLLLQVVENIQREDLHPLEEADHYAKLMRAPNGLQGFASAQELATALGKSTRLVYNRLALLKLGPEAREACFDGKISPSVALELAEGVPAGPDQVKALKELILGWAGEPFSARQTAAHLKKTYMLRLDRARFDTGATYTIAMTQGGNRHVVDVSACGDCPKRTGANPDFFTDVKEGDLCQDAACFNAKTAAAHAQLLEAARDEGATVISGDAATKLMRAGASKPFGHQLLDQPCIAFSDHPKTLRAAVGNAITSKDLVFVDVPGSDAPVIVVSDEVAQRALKAKGLLKITAAMPPKPKAKPRAKDGGGALLAPEAPPPRVVASAVDALLRDDPTDPLFESLLDFEVLPKGSGTNPTAIESRTLTAMRRARAMLMAQALSRHIRTHDEIGLPDGGRFANMVLVQLMYADAYVTTEVAAQMLDIEHTLPNDQSARGFAQMSAWAWELDAELAARMSIMLMALQDPGPDQTIEHFARATGEAVGLDVDAVDAAARELVDKRLQLDLVRHADAAPKKKPAAKPTAKKPAAKKVQA